MSNNGKILIIDDDDDVLKAARLLLKQHFAEIHTEKSPELIPTLLKNESYNVILLDMNFSRDMTSGKEGFTWLKGILELDPSSVVVLITAYGDVEMAVKAIKEGASDFVLKPWQNEKLVATVNAAMRLQHSRKELDHMRSRQKQLSADLDSPFHDFIGSSPAAQGVLTTIEKVAKTDANILLLGENGTGKELAARALHRHSTRATEVFITVDMGAISENLFESELFGHVKGAFTGASENRAGRFEIASGGTLFLDEIGNIPQRLQSKLLTVLQNREIIPVGSNRARSIDIRLICATNMDIRQMVANNGFRQDLLYRINTVEITIPPLRDRKEDIPVLVDYFLTLYSQKYKDQKKTIHAAGLRKLQNYAWPGNIRELKHTIERSVILCDGPVLQPHDIMLPHIRQQNDGIAFEDYNLDQVEKCVIRKVLTKHHGNMSRTAQELGLTRPALYRRVEKYGL